MAGWWNPNNLYSNFGLTMHFRVIAQHPAPRSTLQDIHDHISAYHRVSAGNDPLAKSAVTLTKTLLNITNALGSEAYRGRLSQDEVKAVREFMASDHVTKADTPVDIAYFEERISGLENASSRVVRNNFNYPVPAWKNLN